MKRYLFLLLTLLPLGLNAQRYLPKMSALEVSAGINVLNKPIGYAIGASYSWYTKKKNHWKIGAHFNNNISLQKGSTIPIHQYTAQGGFYYLLVSDPSKSFFLSLGIEAATGYENINHGKKKLADGSIITSRSRWIYGGIAALEMEYYFHDNYIAVLQIRERILAGSDVNYFCTEVLLGIKFIIDFEIIR